MKNARFRWAVRFQRDGTCADHIDKVRKSDIRADRPGFLRTLKQSIAFGGDRIAAWCTASITVPGDAAKL